MALRERQQHTSIIPYTDLFFLLPPSFLPQRLDSTCSSSSTASTPAKPARSRTLTRADFAWVRVIGAGSFGRVSLARNLESGQLVAIKTLSKVAVIRENQVGHARW